MSGKMSDSPRLGRFGRAALLLGVAGATIGGMMLGAGTAQAVVGKTPGAVTLSPASGPVSTIPTWSTTTACASGFQGSAVLREVHADGVSTNSVSRVVNGTAAPFSGSFLGSVAQVQSFAGVANGGTLELVVVCFSGPALQGTSDPEQDIFLTYSADGSTYSTASTLSTTTTLTASPNPARALCQKVTLTATETAADGTHPAGSVQFENNGHNIGSPVAVDASGVATTTRIFIVPGSKSLSAVFTPAGTLYTGSTGTFTETVTW